MTPQVPIIQDSEQLQTGVGRQRVQADPGAFGAAEAQGTAALGRGLERVEGTLGQLDDDFNEANARDLDNQLTQRIRDRMYNPQTGYLSTQQGQDAINTRGQAEADVDTLVNEIGASARNPRARAMYEQIARQRATAALGDIATHATRETQAYENSVFETTLSENTDSAVAAYGDPAAVNENIRSGVAAIRQMGERRGWGEDVTAAREQQFRSGVMQRVIVQLAQTDYAAAEDLYAQIRPDLTAQDAGELLTTMRAVRAQYEQSVEGAIWQAYANGQNPRTLPQWREFSSDPRFGRAHEQYNAYVREQTRAAAQGLHQQNDTPAYWGAWALSQQDPVRFSQELPRLLSEHPEISRSDVGRLLQRQQEIYQGGGANAQSAIFNSVQAVAAPLIGIDLSPTAQEFPGRNSHDRTALTAAQGQAADFNASLAQVVSGFVQENRGRQPNPEETQALIGQALLNMRRAPASVRAGDMAGDAMLRPYVTRYTDIDPGIRVRIQESLARRYPNQQITRQMVEQEYARFRFNTEAPRGP